MISSEALEAFKSIWREEHGEELPDEIAINEAIDLLTMMDVVYRPILVTWVKDENEICEQQTPLKNQPSSAKL